MLLAATEFTTTALLLATFGALLFCCGLTSRAIERLGIPIVLTFLVLGMLAGSEGVGGIAFEDYTLTFRIGTLALILILLDGGLNTPLKAVSARLAPATLLATLGVLITAAIVAIGAWWLGLKPEEALLLGAVVSSTDAAAVFAVLRGSGLRLAERVSATLELESGLNDPMAVILTTTIVSAQLGAPISGIEMLIWVPLQLLIGFVVGLAFGYAIRWILTGIRLNTVGLYPVVTLGGGLLAFGAATLFQGSGFLAVYVAALILGNGPLPYRNGLARIHDALAWLGQTAMFLTLGLLVFPSELPKFAGIALLIALVVAVAARFVAALVCLLPFRFPLSETLYIGWVGLRGAVPIVLATYPVLSGVPGAMTIFNIVFFIVVVNALIPGSTLRWVTRLAGLETPEQPRPIAALEINSTRLLRGELMSFHITPALAVCDAMLSQIPFPPDSAAILVVRSEQLLAARGTTLLRPGDHVYIFCRPEDRPFIELLFGEPQQDA